MAVQAPGRRLVPGTLGVSPGGVWVVDAELPVLAFVDARDLSVRLVGSWFEESALSGWSSRLEVCTALAGAEDGCWIASPDARGVIWLGRDGKSLFGMPAPVRALAYAKGACWAVLDVARPYDSRDPLPLWRLDGTGVRSFAAGFRIFDVIAAGDGVFALGHTQGDDDPLRIVVLGVADNGQVEPLEWVELRHGWRVRALAGPAGPWLEFDSAGAEWPAQRWIEPLERSRGGWQRGRRIPLPPGVGPAAVDEGSVAWSRVRAERGAADYDHLYAVRRVPLDGSADSGLVLPGRVGALVARGDQAWCVSAARLPQLSAAPPRSLLRLTHAAPVGIELTRVEGWPGIEALIPDIRPPDRVDPVSWAESRCAGLQAGLAAWTNPAARAVPRFAGGVTIESVSLAGSYPATECVIRFRVHDRHGVAFGRRVRCFDDLGAPRPCEHAAVELMESIATGGLPPPGRDIPAEEGIVWI
jgi:hypothetical protein